ncbi:tetratricopeptide repeat protein [Pelagibacterium sp.]|uniref:tetratricopeptide repeat protein n=1 Tax=Pelagibacterium sp. TaxID=1967288 RepID=UPI003A8CC66E
MRTPLAAILVMMLGSTAFGQDASGTPPEMPVPQTQGIPSTTAPTAPASPTSPQSVDETALRYFARQGDQRRVDAEIARLRTLYPDWDPPENLLTDDYVPDASIERIWELYGDGDFAGARAAIAEKQSNDPEWQPTEDMLRSLQLGEAAQRMRNASDADQYETVVSIAVNMPELLICSNVDLLWRLAEAFVKTDNDQRAIDAYTYVLNNCDDGQERLATVQQASELLNSDQLDGLLALERMAGDGAGEFEPIRLDLARNALVAVLSGQSPRARNEDVRRLEASVASTNNAEDLRLLGWYALNQRRPTQALSWFETAMDEDPSVLSANGLGVALLDLDRPAEAEEILLDYEGENEEMTLLYLSATAATLARTPRVELDPEVLERIVAIGYDNRHVQTAQELGWYALDFGQPQTAIAWFETALGWDTSDEGSAFGLVVASDQLGDDARVAEIKAEWSGRSQRIADFGTSAAQDESRSTQSQSQAPTSIIPTAQAPVAAAPQTRNIPPRQPQPAVAVTATRETASVVTPAPTSITVNAQGCSSYVPPGNYSPGQALNRAWCLMELLRPSEAVEAFQRALQSSSTDTRSDAAYGQALAYVRMGLPEHASVAAAAAPQSQARSVELQTAILTLTALSAYNTGDYRRALVALDERSLYAVERNDLLTLRAWSYFHLGRYVEAEQIFGAVAATGYGQALEGFYAAQGRIRR